MGGVLILNFKDLRYIFSYFKHDFKITTITYNLILQYICN